MREQFSFVKSETQAVSSSKMGVVNNKRLRATGLELYRVLSLNEKLVLQKCFTILLRRSSFCAQLSCKLCRENAGADTLDDVVFSPVCSPALQMRVVHLSARSILYSYEHYQHNSNLRMQLFFQLVHRGPTNVKYILVQLFILTFECTNQTCTPRIRWKKKA